MNLDNLKSIRGNYDRINIFKEVFKENSKLIDIIIKNYVIEKEDSIYKKQFKKKYISSILKSNFNCNTNDFIDELIFEFYDSLYIEDICFISLDKKYLKFLISLGNYKIKESINYINSQVGDLFKFL